MNWNCFNKDCWKDVALFFLYFFCTSTFLYDGLTLIFDPFSWYSFYDFVVYSFLMIITCAQPKRGAEKISETFDTIKMVWATYFVINMCVTLYNPTMYRLFKVFKLGIELVGFIFHFYGEFVTAYFNAQDEKKQKQIRERATEIYNNMFKKN